MSPSEMSRESLSTCIFKSHRDQALPGSHTPYRFVSISKVFIFKLRFTYPTGGVILTLAKAVINI